MSARLGDAVVTLSAVGCAINGGFMLLAPARWFALIPGAAATGPFNGHFVQDVGIAFLTCALAYALALVRPLARRPLLAVAAAFLALHAGLHVIDALSQGDATADELIATVAPGLVAVILALAARRQPRHP